MNRTLLFILLLMLTLARCGKKEAGPDNPVPVNFWHWSGKRTITEKEGEILNSLNTKMIFVFRGFIEKSSDSLKFVSRGGDVSVPSGIETHTVFRISPLLSTNIVEDKEEFIKFIAGQYKAFSDSNGLQIDCDVPTSKIGKYAEFLNRLRRLLPEGTILSVTALLDWLNTDELEDLMNAADFIVPQLYTTDLPKNTECSSLVFGGKIMSAVRTLDTYNRPYMIGLPVFRRSAVFSPEGKLLAAAADISLNDGITKGGNLVRHDRYGDENITAFKMQNGNTVLVGLPKACGLADRISTTRLITNKQFMGICLYRLPCPEDTGTMSLRQIKAAYTKSVKYPQVNAVLNKDQSGFTLHIQNKGDEDYIDFKKPVTISISSEKGKVYTDDFIPGTRMWNILPGMNGVPCSAKRANGLVVSLPVVRAGSTLEINGIKLEEENAAISKIKAVLSVRGIKKGVEIKDVSR